MKTLKSIIVENKKNDELINNSCVDEFIKYLQDKSIIHSYNLENESLYRLLYTRKSEIKCNKG